MNDRQFFREYNNRKCRSLRRQTGGQNGNRAEIYSKKAAGKPELVFYDPSNSDKYLLDKDGKWSAQAANEYMTTLLSSYNTANKNMVELVICNNDGMAEGAISALNVAGFNTGKPDSVTIPVFISGLKLFKIDSNFSHMLKS